MELDGALVLCDDRGREIRIVGAGAELRVEFPGLHLAWALRRRLGGALRGAAPGLLQWTARTRLRAIVTVRGHRVAVLDPALGRSLLGRLLGLGALRPVLPGILAAVAGRSAPGTGC